MKKNFVLLFILGILPITTIGQEIEVIDGFYYELDTLKKTAEVTRGMGDCDYSNVVKISSKITFNNCIYTVTSIGESHVY